MNKKCPKCGEIKRLDEFHKNRANKNGIASWCKPCLILSSTAWADANRDKKREADRVRIRLARASGKVNQVEDSRLYRLNNPEKVRAHKAVYRAVRKGILKKSTCEVCGTDKVHAHHNNYDLPLKVNWLCPVHHKAIH